MIRTAYFENLEREAVLLRELLAITYNVNVKKQDRKSAGQLFPFQFIEKPFDPVSNFENVKKIGQEAREKWLKNGNEKHAKSN